MGQYCKHTGALKRCQDCIRPLCQRNLLAAPWIQDLSEPMNEYMMHDLFSGV